MKKWLYLVLPILFIPILISIPMMMYASLPSNEFKTWTEALQSMKEPYHAMVWLGLELAACVGVFLGILAAAAINKDI